ncbi:stalk domain-containing protein [Paenibacillus tuaregi]|uniref:stalk domain-containing protein n=1 Tax=Paenibacillus tuaregi TaxID=1816681 RepID=UPI00083917BF|nr:stalk domain-containing protein [Paenibacillus tuaregi]
MKLNHAAKYILMFTLAVGVTLTPSYSNIVGHGVVSAAEQSLTNIKAEDIRQATLSQADLTYRPLFGSREADKQALTEISSFINQFTAKGTKETIKPGDSSNSFFSYKVDLSFKDGSNALLYNPQNSGGLVLEYKETRISLADAQLTKLTSLFVMGKSASLSPASFRIGDPVRISGSDDLVEDGQVNVFWTPGKINSYTPTESATGAEFPSKSALLIYRGPSHQARYDFKFTFPVYGEAWDGSLGAIHPGAGSITITPARLHKSFPVNVQPAASLSLSVNGFPVTDPSLQPISYQGITLLPLRAVGALLGEALIWDAKHQSVLIRTPLSAVSGKPSGGVRLWIDGKPAASDLKPVIVRNGVTYVPVRAATGAFGQSVLWLEPSKNVTIILKPALLSVNKYATGSLEREIAGRVNEYVSALNRRNLSKLKTLFAKDEFVFPKLENLGNRLITKISGFRLEKGTDPNELVAYVEFRYLSDPNGRSSTSVGIVFRQTDGKWKITDVD